MTVPTTRTNPFDPPAELVAAPPVGRLTFADGSLGWLVTEHAAARFVLSDPRFSSRLDLARSPIRVSAPASVPGAFLFMDPPDHTRYRKLLTGQFTLRRMRELEPRIADIAADRLAAIEEAGPPADLVRMFALPLASLVICSLLGVPYEAHERFEHASRRMVDPTLSEVDREVAASPSPRRSTSLGTRPVTWLSGTACTSASASNWPGSSFGSGFRRCCPGSRT